MDKVWKSKKYKRYHKRHTRRQFEASLRYRNYKRAKNFDNGLLSYPEKIERSRLNQIKKDYTIITAPNNFSFIENTEEMNIFIQKVSTQFEKKNRTFIDLKNVTHVAYNAMVVLLSIMIQFKSNKIKFNGNFPDDPEARKIIEQSGFMKYISQRFSIDEKYDLQDGSDGICTHALKKVDSQLSSHIIREASQVIWGEPRRCQGVQRTFLELMQNTNNHAILETEGEKHWWLSVKYFKDSKKVSFSFVDFGVGIFTSLENKPVQSRFYDCINRLKKFFSFQSNSELLKLVLSGDLHKTVTNKTYRGKGLPGIREALDRNQISNLHIITNNVFADVQNGRYIDLVNPFSGTFVYWELDRDNESCKA